MRERLSNHQVIPTHAFRWPRVNFPIITLNFAYSEVFLFATSSYWMWSMTLTYKFSELQECLMRLEHELA